VSRLSGRLVTEWRLMGVFGSRWGGRGQRTQTSLKAHVVICEEGHKCVRHRSNHTGPSSCAPPKRRSGYPAAQESIHERLVTANEAMIARTAGELRLE